MTTTRGIVVTNRIVAKTGEFEFNTSPFDPQELRYWLLFWDKLNCPLLEGIEIGLCQEGTFLEGIGILQRQRVDNVTFRIWGHGRPQEPTEQVAHHLLRAFRTLDAAEPETWTLATGERCLTLDASEMDTGRGILFRLHRALPVPDKDVPLDDILQFKERRRPELIGLRSQLEAAYQRVVSSPDRPLAESSELAALDLALSNLLKAREGGAVKRWISADISFDLQPMRGINAAVIGHMAGLPLTEAVAFGAYQAFIQIEPTVSLRRLQRDKAVPWRYVAKYHDDVFSPR